MKIVKYHSGAFDGGCPSEDTLAILLSETETQVTKVVNGKEVTKTVKLANLAVFQDSDQVVVRKTGVPHAKDSASGTAKDGEGKEVAVDHPYWEAVKE